jgi:hypothetical protein
MSGKKEEQRGKKEASFKCRKHQLHLEVTLHEALREWGTTGTQRSMQSQGIN